MRRERCGVSVVSVRHRLVTAWAALVVVVVGTAGFVPGQSRTAGAGSAHQAGGERVEPKSTAAEFTKGLTRDLTKRNFRVGRGYPMLWTQQGCDRYTYPIMGSCFANNPAAPYVLAIMKSWRGEFVDPATVNAFGKTRPGYSATYRLDPREAIVVFGKMPPPARYMGLQSYVFTKEWLTDDEPWNPSVHAEIQAKAPQLYDYLFNTAPGNPSRVQSFSSLSNSINDVVIRRQSGSAFGRNRYFIITPDRAMKGALQRALIRAGVERKKMFTEPIPPSHPLGFGARADDFMTGIRYALPDNAKAGRAWRRYPPLTVLRVRERPSSDRLPKPFGPFVPDERTAAPEDVYAADLDNLVTQVCQRWGQPCDPDNPRPDQLSRLLDLEHDLYQFGPECRAIGMNCQGDGQDASYFIAPGHPLDPGWVYAVLGTLATETGNATYVGLSVNDMSKLKGVLNIPDTQLSGSAASYAGAVQNTDKFFVHYFTRDCGAISGLTDGECTTITKDMVPPLGTGKKGLFSAALRAYVRPGTERGPLSTEQLRPMIIRFTQP